MHRRDYLLALGAATGLAGCTSGSDDEPEAVDTETTASDTGSDDTSSTESSTETAETPTSASAVVGELVEGDTLNLVVEEFERGAQPSEFLEPESGNEFAIARLAIKNVSDEYVTVSNLLQTRLRDGEGYQYSQTFVGGDEPTFNDGQFAPGEIERGAIAFEVPMDASNLSLVFDFDVAVFGGLERATVDVETTADTPHTLEQTLQVDTFDVGQAVEYGDVQVTVSQVSTASSIGRFTEPDDGNEFVIVDLAITNNTGESQRFSTALQMMVKDGEGYTYQADIGASSQLDRAFDEGTPLSDGETRPGKLAYEVPEGKRPLYWVFEFELFATGDKTFWQIR